MLTINRDRYFIFSLCDFHTVSAIFGIFSHCELVLSGLSRFEIVDNEIDLQTFTYGRHLTGDFAISRAQGRICRAFCCFDHRRNRTVDPIVRACVNG